jgi:hypothetical protein
MSGDEVTWARQLDGLSADHWPAFLAEHSGLPGPRADLTLVTAAALRADDDTIAALIADGGEFTAMCAAAALGNAAGDQPHALRARDLARDQRWRVREGVAIGLQLWGDRDPRGLTALVRAWADDPDLLVRRAAIAAICEPRLLRTPDAAAVAVDACRRATRGLLAEDPGARRRPDARTLRQALGYCWSVAVAADPAAGLGAFRELDDADPDVAWIVRENRKKKRLSALL